MNQLPQIPGYNLIKKLGHGGMADVYLGVQEKLARPVAIKVMDPLLLRDEQFAKRFLKEAQTAAQLAHPNIITIHDVGDIETPEGHYHYIVMEYLEESLSERLKKYRCLPPKEALDIINKIAGALDYAHKKGFIHRDIKPDNIMFRSNGSVVLVDFGIARAVDSNTQLTQVGTSIGTPHYMSPEQCKGEKIDGRSDIYSLGVQLYEMLTGEVPYKAENTTGIIIKQIQDPVPLLPQELKHYQPLIEAMMAKDKEMRVQSGQELVNFIEALGDVHETLPTRELTRPTLASYVEEGFATIPTPAPMQVNVSTKTPTRTPSMPPAAQQAPSPKKSWAFPVLIACSVCLLGIIIFILFRSPSPGPIKVIDNKLPVNNQPDSNPVESKPVEIKTQEPLPTDIKTKEPVSTGPFSIEPKTVELKSKEPVSKYPEIVTDKQKTDKGKKPNPEPEIPKDQKGKSPQGKDKIIWGNPNITPAPEEKQSKETVSPRMVTILDLPLELRQRYNDRMQRIIIPVLKSGFQVGGQVSVNLLVNETGSLTVLSMDNLIAVSPEEEKSRVSTLIETRLNALSLMPPRGKDGEPVRFKFRITFKVGKFGKTIILTKL